MAELAWLTISGTFTRNLDCDDKRVVRAETRCASGAGVERVDVRVLLATGTTQMNAITKRGIELLIPPDSSRRKGVRPGWRGGAYQAMHERLATGPGAELYRKRRPMIEPVFGQTKGLVLGGVDRLGLFEDLAGDLFVIEVGVAAGVRQHLRAVDRDPPTLARPACAQSPSSAPNRPASASAGRSTQRAIVA